MASDESTKGRPNKRGLKFSGLIHDLHIILVLVVRHPLVRLLSSWESENM